MKKIVAIFYDKKEKDDALHTKEVFENECRFHKFNLEEIDKNSIKVNDVIFHFIDFDQVKRLKYKTYNVCYVSTRLKKKVEETFADKLQQIKTNPRPSQSIIDLVEEVRQKEETIVQ